MSDLDLDIEPGEHVLLLGASGSGKSTLLRGLAGVLGDAEDGEDAGELLIDGRSPVAVRGRAGLVLQDPDAQVILARVGDDVAFACENLGVPADEIWRRVDEALGAVGLDVPRDHPTSALSGGQKQRLALAGALAMRPGLLLLDEPTANLDPAGAVAVRDAVVEVAAQTGATLIVVEHRVSLWADHVHRVIVLGADGGVLADGPAASVFGAHARTLSDAGVWVPGVAAGIDARPRSESGDALLTATGVAVGRRAFGERMPRIVASGIDAQLRAGRALAITGPNGAGKSTFAMTLAGLLPPADGVVIASAELIGGPGGHPGVGVGVPARGRGAGRSRRGSGSPGASPHLWRARDLLTRIGTVFQDPEHQLLTTRVRDELAVGPRALGLSDAEIASRVDPLLDRLRLTRLADVNPFTLSGGEKRRLTVAATLASRPRVLLLDEPTYGQDARTWRELADLIDEQRAAGAAIAFVSHDPALVAALADDALTIMPVGAVEGGSGAPTGDVRGDPA